MQTKNLPKIAAVSVGIATILGFCIILFLPSIYKAGSWGVMIIGGQIMILPIGALAASLLGLLIYLIFKNFIRNKIIYTVSLIIAILICMPLGVWLNMSILRMLASVGSLAPAVLRIDTNSDGKVDKWVYHDTNSLSTRIELDTDYDGDPDTREYYKNGELIKRDNIAGPEM